MTIMITYLSIGSFFCVLFGLAYSGFKKESSVEKERETGFIIMLFSFAMLLWPIILLMLIIDTIKGTPRNK